MNARTIRSLLAALAASLATLLPLAGCTHTANPPADIQVPLPSTTSATPIAAPAATPTSPAAAGTTSPAGVAPEAEPNPSRTIIDIMEDGTIVVDQRVVALDQLPQVLKNLRKNHSENWPILIAPEPKVKFSVVIDVLGAACDVGFRKISFSTRGMESSDKPAPDS